MIAFIQGNLALVTENSMVIDCHGIGYEVHVTSADLSRMPIIGSEVRVYTYMNINENTGVTLFGFLDADDLAMFKLLITVNGIGPKGAVAILSAVDADALRFAILAEDVKTIEKAPGIGKKTAAKLMLELKDKISLQETFENRLAKIENLGAVTSAENQAKEEAILALVSLGDSTTEEAQAVAKVTMQEGITVDEVLGQSLKYM